MRWRRTRSIASSSAVAQRVPCSRRCSACADIARVLQEVGALERLLPNMSPISEYRFENADGEVLLQQTVSSRTAVSGWAGSYMFVQPELERVLRARLSEIVGTTP